MRNFQLSDAEQAALREVLGVNRLVPADLLQLKERLEPAKAMERIVGFPDGEPLGLSDPGLTPDEEKGLAALEEALEHSHGRSRVRIEEEVRALKHKRVGAWDPEEYPQRAGLKCPYCGAVAWDGGDDGIRVVDVAERWSSFGYRDKERTIHGDYDDRGADFDGDRYECEACGHEVELPEDVEEDGW